MKFLLLAAFVASISAASWRGFDPDEDFSIEPRSNQYENGKEYVYRFRSQVLSSLPTYTNTYGGVKIVSKVKMAFTASHKATLQMEDIRLYSHNNEIRDPNDLKPFKQLPEDQFTPLPSNHAQMIANKLSLPVKVTCQDHKVISMQITDQEVNWSLDIKRSVLQMLQLQLKNTDFTTNPKLLYNDLEQNNSTTFNFLEPGLDGTCHSEITVRPVLRDSKLFKVVKSRDPVNFLKVNSIQKSTWRQKVSNCNCKENFNKRSCQCKPLSDDFDSKLQEYSQAKTVTECEVKSEDRINHVVKKCTQSAHYKHLFPGTKHQYMSTISNQTLSLIEENDAQTVQTSSHTFKSVDQPWKQQILQDREEKPMLTQQQISTMVRSILSELLVISNNRERADDHLTVFKQLVEMLKLCQQQQQLETLFTETKQADWRKWKLFIDALAHTNKTITDTFLLDKIVSGEISQNEAVPLLMTWASDKVPTVNILDKFVQSVIPTFENKVDREPTYQHILLSFGAMVRRYVHWEEIQLSQCVLEQDRILHRKNIAASRKYEKVLEGKLGSASTDEQKITLLKAMANVGSIEALPVLQQLMDTKQSTAVRVHAVYALKSLTHQNRLKVLQTLQPLLYNHNEDSEVRVAALNVILHCQPGLAQMQNMLNNEPDLDFKTFAVKFMRNILSLRSREYDTTQKWIAQVLKGVRAFQMSSQSQSIFLQYRQRPDGDGDLLSYASLMNQTSSFLRSVSYRHDAIVRGRLHSQTEFGYRAEGLEHIVAKLQDRESAIRKHQNLDVLQQISTGSKSKMYSYKKVRPSITLYVRSSGKHVSMLHFDEDTINQKIMQGTKDGKIEIPVKIFQTWLSKPEQNQKLQPHGMWQVNEKAHLLILDVEGTIQIMMQEGQLPTIHFVASRPLRTEHKDIQSVYVKCGFMHTGVLTALARRFVLSNAEWKMTYSLPNNNLTYTITNPSHELERIELKGYTNTFVLPIRLPDFVSRKVDACRDVQTDESDRKTFSYQIESMKSVDIDAQVEGNVYMPELYGFVRDRISLLPAQWSFHKQEIKYTARPSVSSQRVYQFSLANFDLSYQMTLDQQQQQKPEQQQQQQQQQQSSQSAWQQQKQEQSQQKSMYGTWLSSMFSSQQNVQTPEGPAFVQSSQSFLTPSQFLKPQSMGAIRTLMRAHISSSSSQQWKYMVANLTTQHEYETPTIRSLLLCERSPIPGEEQDKVVLRMDFTQTYNPSVNQILFQRKIQYGEQSQQNKPFINILGTRTPTYKENVCYEENAYGCEDQFGVTYPIWYNGTSQIKYRNTELPLDIYKAMKTYLTNIAQSVTMEPAHHKPETQPLFSRGQQQQTLNVSMVYRSLDSTVDAQFNFEGFRYNLTRIYMPNAHTAYQMFDSSLTYPMGRTASISDSTFIPRHRRVDAFTARDICVVGNTRVFSIDGKEIQMPRSDCEVLLMGDCGTKQRELLVSLKPASPRSSASEKILKVVLGDTKIELQYTPTTTFTRANVKVKVNGQPRELDQNNQLTIESRGQQIEPEQKQQPFIVRQQMGLTSFGQLSSIQPLAVVECEGSRCALRSQKYGIFVAIDSQKSHVEVDSSKSPYMCGICSRHPELPRLASDEASINAFKANKIPGDDQCTTSDSIEPRRSENVCRKIYRHKLMYKPLDGEIKRCITVNAVPLCNNKCEKKAIRVERQTLRCVDEQEARRLEIASSIQGEEQFIPDDQMNRLLTKLSGAKTITEETPLAQSCE